MTNAQHVFMSVTLNAWSIRQGAVDLRLDDLLQMKLDTIDPAYLLMFESIDPILEHFNKSRRCCEADLLWYPVAQGALT